MFARLAETWRYRRALERLALRAVRRGRPRLLAEGGPDLRDLRHELDVVASKLADVVSQGRYRFSPFEPHTVFVDKPRVLYAMTAADHAVLMVLAELLSEVVEPTLPDGLHSYRRGRSAHTALRSLADYLDHHRCTTPLGERALYVLRRDVRAYGDSIAADDDSALWPMLEQALGQQPAGFLPFVRSAFRPPVRHADGHVAPLDVGIPNGNPCQTLACNLYCQPLDQALGRLSGGLYLRYGDDLLFAHPDPSVARQAAEVLDAKAAELKLLWGEEKSRALYFTAPGRKPPPAERDFAPAPRVEYVGASVAFDGARSLKPVRVRQLLHRLRMRLHHALAKDGSPSDLAARTALAVEVIRQALDVRSPVCDPLAEVLAGPMDDRAQLRQLDHAIALLVAQRACRQRGVRAFRRVPPRSLYAQGLPSLVAQRNRGGGRAA